MKSPTIPGVLKKLKKDYSKVRMTKDEKESLLKNIMERINITKTNAPGGDSGL